MQTTPSSAIARNRRSSGSAIIYVIVTMAAMIGFCSMAVDLARVQVAKTELRRAADAAAIYACQGISDGTYASRAVTAAAENLVDNQPLVLQASDITLGTWANHTFTAGGTTPNAVQIKATRSKARGTAIPLVFAQIIGQPTCDVNAQSVALFSQQTVTPYVSCASDPWLAGEPTGTTASVTDAGYQGDQVNSVHPWAKDVAGPVGGKAASGQPYNSPVQVAISVTPGSTIRLTNVTGTGTNDPTLTMCYSNGYDVNGNPATGAYDWAAVGTGSEHGISTTTAPHNSIIGVFLNNNLPDTDPAPQPPALDFSTQTARDYSNLAPLLRQPFYVGDGQTSSSVQQQIVVPAGATRLFLGTMDGHEWSNNVGGFNATITQTTVSLVQ